MKFPDFYKNHIYLYVLLNILSNDEAIELNDLDYMIAYLVISLESS